MEFAVKRIHLLMTMSLLLLVLCSCATAVRETGFVRDEWWTEGYENPFVDRDRTYVIRYRPFMSASTPCVSKSFLSFGPLFVIPLPIIPNPIWPFSYLKYRYTPASISLTLQVPRSLFDRNKLKTDIILDGTPLEVIQVKYTPDEYHLEYVFDTKKTCKEIENLPIVVRVSGGPEPIEETFRYVHNWRIFAEGI